MNARLDLRGVALPATPPRPAARPYVLIGTAVTVGVVLELQLRFVMIARELSWSSLLSLAAESAFVGLFVFGGAMAAVYAIDWLVPSRSKRLLLRPIAMIAAGSAAAATIHGLLQAQPLAVLHGLASSGAALILHNAWQALAFGTLAGFCIDSARQRQQAEERVRLVQDALLRERRSVLQSRLQSLEARVDPQLLFATLERIKQQYLQGPPKAEQALDDLSAYLRAVLQQMQSARSTLGRELDVAGAYVRLASAGRPAGMELRVDMPEALRSTPLPAGVLLPLLRRPLAAGPARLGLTARRIGEDVRLLLNAAQAFDALALADVRGILGELYGDRARVVSAHLPDGHVVRIEVPVRG